MNGYNIRTRKNERIYTDWIDSFYDSVSSGVDRVDKYNRNKGFLVN